MYTVVLATMLTAGSASADWHCFRGCYCSGAYCSTCYSGYSGYSGYAGYGCYGCYSACSCYSGCSCSSSHIHWRPFHAFRPFDPITPPSFCCSTYYVAPYCCSSYCCSSYIVPQSGPQVVPVPPKSSEKVPAPKSSQESDISTPTTTTSRVTVTLPSNARLWVDNVECPLTSSERAFTTPALDPNALYTYNLKIEVVRDGRPVTATQRVVIVPGQPVTVNFNNNEAIVSR